MLVERHKNLAILVGGGPAPGINSVISAATIRAQLDGVEVVGIRDGFERIMHGDIDHVTPLTIDADAFKTAGGDLESSLRLICEKVHAYGNV